MKTIIAKVRPKFLSLIKNGIKKHEYRLASPKYTSLNIGDRMVLVSNQNSKEYSIVRINKIMKFFDWESALEKFWEDDFKDLYSDFDELIKECHKFYSSEEIKEYGIDVFEINLDDINFKKARFLLDTNIIIQRESDNNYCSEISYVYKSIDNFHGKKLYHSITEKELSEYKDENIKNLMITKLKSYEKLSEIKIEDDYFKRIVSSFGDDLNSQNDNEILYQAYSGRVDFLITEDREIIRKAKLLYLQDRVMSSNTFLTKIEKQNPSLISYDALSVSLVEIGTLDFKDPFFDSLREDYGGIAFDNWLTKKAESKAYVFKNNEGIQGFLYLKQEDEKENYSDFIPQLPPKKRLKVGTFKIKSTGIRLGERFLKIIFDNALKYNVEEVYVTMFKDKREEVVNLKKLMEEWGFVEKGNKKNGEIFLIKDIKNYDKEKNPKFNYPMVNEKNLISYLPINMKFHTKLFPDLHLKNENATFFDSACSYAIEKIYVTAWNNVDLTPGSLLCVYYMADYNKKYRSSVTGICILNEVIKTFSPDDLVKICKNRSVFTESELKELYIKRKYTTVIKILYLKSFDRKVTYEQLEKEKLLGSCNAPRLNSIIPYEKYLKLVKLGEEKS